MTTNRHSIKICAIAEVFCGILCCRTILTLLLGICYNSIGRWRRQQQPQYAVGSGRRCGRNIAPP